VLQQLTTRFDLEGHHQTTVTKNMEGRQGADYESDLLTKLS